MLSQYAARMKKKSMASQSGLLGGRLLVGVLVCAGIMSLVIARTSPATAGKAASLYSEAPANTSQRALSFAERVSYQRAIEEAYWRHRIWPKDNRNPKPTFDAAISHAALEKKVQDYLRESQALEDYWHRAITAQQLQAEMNRMAEATKQPEVLRDLFEALGNDPFVIAECLARPVLIERLLGNEYGRVGRGAAGQRAEVGLKESSPVNAENSMPDAVMVPNSGYSLPTIAEVAGGCTDDTWAATAIGPFKRADHTAIWTGNEMIIWAGVEGQFAVNTGARYNPVTNSWTATNTINAPAPGIYTAVWTGSEMIVWTGPNGGGKYNPNTNSWTAISNINAPTLQSGHSAVWTGSEMIVWGGTVNCQNFFQCGTNTGGREKSNTRNWGATST